MVTIQLVTVLLLGLPMVVSVVELGKLVFQQIGKMKRTEKNIKDEIFCETISDENKHALGKHSRIWSMNAKIDGNSNCGGKEKQLQTKGNTQRTSDVEQAFIIWPFVEHLL